MCYICEAQGHVGKHYRKALAEIGKAWKAWGPSRKRNCFPQPYYPGPKPEGGDWLKAPTRAEPWIAADFEKWQAAHRYTPLPENDPTQEVMRRYTPTNNKPQPWDGTSAWCTRWT